MKKSVFVQLFSAMVCVLGMMTSCNSKSEKTSWEVDGIKGRVKTERHSIYNAVVKFGETQKGELEHYADLPLPRYSSYSCISITNYNEDGMRTSIDNYDDDMELRSKYVFAFDGKKLSSIKAYDEDGELDYEITFTYDSETGKLIEQVERSYSKYKPYLYHYKYSYDEDGTLHGETYHKDGAVEKWSVQEKMKKGKIQKRVQCDEQGNPTIITLFDDEEHVLSILYKTTGDSISYSYNENGDVVHLTQIRKEYKFEYEYDKHNNWIRRITYKGIKPLYIEEREIEYY